MRVSLLVHLIFPLVGCCLAETLLHPLLSELRVLAVLLNAAALGLKLVETPFGSVLTKSHTLIEVHERIRWGRLPAHHIVLLLEQDPLGGPGSTDRAHVVRLVVGIAGKHTSRLEDLAIVVRTECFGQGSVACEACARMLPNLGNDESDLVRE